MARRKEDLEFGSGGRTVVLWSHDATGPWAGQDTQGGQRSPCQALLASFAFLAGCQFPV